MTTMQQIKIDIGLVLPYIEAALSYFTLFKRFHKRLGIGGLATRRIDEIGLALKRSEESSIGHMERGMLAITYKRRVQCNNIGFAGNGLQRYKPLLAPFSTGRVAT